jgi:hypothetical protein
MPTSWCREPLCHKRFPTPCRHNGQVGIGGRPPRAAGPTDRLDPAARGQLRVGLPVGLVWGSDDGQILLHPDEAVTGVIAAVFDQFAASGSVRATWLWLRDNQLCWPLQQAGYRRDRLPEIAWVEPTYHAVHTTLTHPAYAGAYVFGRTRADRYVADGGQLRTRQRRLHQDEWEVLITEHHPGFIDWDTYQANQARIGANIQPERHAPGTGAVREGAALLQGLATCGDCGRKLAVFYRGPAKSTPGYYCNGTGDLVDGKGVRHLGGRWASHRRHRRAGVPGRGVPGGGAGVPGRRRAAGGRLRHRLGPASPPGRTSPLHRDQGRTPLPRGRPGKPAGRPRPGSRMGGRPASRPRRRCRTGTARAGPLLHALLDDVVITVDNQARTARLVLHWKGGMVSETSADLPRPKPPYRTSEDTISLIGRLAAHYDDSMIAKVLNQQQRRTAQGVSFTPANVATIRKRNAIPARQGGTGHDEDGEVMSVHQAAAGLGITASTLYRWVNDGFVPGEQITPGAPWRIRLTDSIHALVADDAPAGWVPVQVATAALGVSRQTVLQRVKRGGLRAVHIRAGRRKGLRIELPARQDGLF